jgi:pimeloyl-ACP methyl ester carboxylesterase
MGAPGIEDSGPVRADDLGLIEGLLLRSGARADRTILRVIQTLFLATNRRPAEHAGTDTQRDAFALYSDEALVAAPERFFRAPSGPPVATAVRETVVRALPDGGAVTRYRFPSTYRTFDASYQAQYDSYVENRNGYVHAWVHRPVPGAPPPPALIAIHGWAQGTAWVDERALAVAQLYARGLDVHLFVLPFHGPRTPRSSRLSGLLFPSTSVRRTSEGFGQAIHDLRTWAAHLRRDAPDRAVGVLGMSLGGYTTALWASLDPTLTFAVPLIPMVSMADLMWEHGNGMRERAKAEARGITLETMRRAFALHCPLSHRPRLAPERLLILAGLGDRICHPSQARALWEHWGRPHIHWFPGGHLLWFGRREMRSELDRFLQRLGLVAPEAS